MRHFLIVSLALSAAPAFAGLREQMMNNPKVMEYVRNNPSVMFSGMAFMNRHPNIDKMGPAALQDPAIRRELKEAGLTEVMTIAMGQMKQPAKAEAAPKPAAAKPQATKAAAPAAKPEPVARKEAAPAAPKKVASVKTPRLNTTYVVRKNAGLKADRQNFSMNSAGVHLTGKKSRVKEEKGYSHWLQVADAKGRTGWVNIGAKYNLGGNSAITVKSAPKAPAEIAKVQPSTATPAEQAPVTPTTVSQAPPAKEEAAKPQETECAKNGKEFETKPNLKKAFKDSNPFAQTWYGPVPGAKLAPGDDALQIELTPELQTMASGMIPDDPQVKPRMTAMLDTMKKSGNRAPFDFMVCVDGDGKGPYRSDLGNKAYFEKDLRSVKVATPGMPEAPFSLDDPAATSASK